MIVLVGGQLVHEALCVKLTRGLAFPEDMFELRLVNAGAEAQIHIGVGFFHRVQNVVAFVLRVVHSELVLNVLRQRMHLQAQILAVHGVQHIEADREFLAKAGVYLVAQQGHRLGKHQIDRRGF